MKLSGWSYLFVVSIAVWSLCPKPLLCQEQENHEAATTINALMDKMNGAWTDEGHPGYLNEFFSDKSFVFAIPRPDNPSEATIVDKASYCQYYDSTIRQKRTGSIKHDVKDIAVVGPLAYEIGSSSNIAADGQVHSADFINIFAKDESGWKLVSSTFAGDARIAFLSSPTDKNIAQKLAHEFVAAFRTENPTPISRLEEMLSDDFIQVRSIGEVEKGKKANLRLYREGIEEIGDAFRTMTVRYDISSVTCFTEGAVVFGKLVLEGRLRNQDKRFRRELFETLVFRRDGAGWQLIQEHSTLVSSGIGAAL